MGGELKRILLVGCDPTPFDPETEMEIAISAPVRAAIPAAMEMIHALVEKLKRESNDSKLKGTDEHACLRGTHA